MSAAQQAMRPWMIYGVNGYTGRLCAIEAYRRGLRPILAGRSAERVARVVAELGLPHRVFDLADPVAAIDGLGGVAAVLNCAGPFSATARSLLAACAETKTHYLDVTGEIGVFEYVHGHRERWKEAGIVALPGVGCDVVPTDCMAAMLKAAMPAATRLRLAFKMGQGRMSPGTAKTVIESLGGGFTVRRNGNLVRIPTGSIACMIPYVDGPALSAIIPWGDVSTAFHSTGIPNIEVYVATTESQLRLTRLAGHVAGLLQWTWVQSLLKRWVDWKVAGPDEAERAGDDVEFYGDVDDAQGRRVAMTMHTPNGYSLTFDAAVSSVERVLAGSVAAGAHTPSTAFGGSFISTLAGVRHSEPALMRA